MNIAKEAEYGARTYVQTATKTVSAIEDARRGILHPLLINTNQLAKVTEEIERSTPDTIFPIAKEKIDLALLSQISDVQTAYHDKKFLIIIEIPLISRNQMELYKMVPCKVPQKIQGNRSVAAYIEPAKKYIALSQHDAYYTHFDEDYLNSCIPFEKCLACQKGIPLRKAGNRNSCEYRLLTNTDVALNSKIYQDCNVKITNDLETQWTRLTSSKGWLYSTIEPERLEITCHNQPSDSVILNGSGMLHLNPNCTAETSPTILEGAGLVGYQLPVILGIPKTINISEIAPVLNDLPKPLSPMSTRRQYVLPDTAKDRLFDDSLQQTVDEAEKIGLHHQETYYHRIFTATNGTITLVLTVVMAAVGYGTYKKAFSLLNVLACCCRRSKRAKQQPARAIVRRPGIQGLYEEPISTISMPELTLTTVPRIPALQAAEVQRNPRNSASHTQSFVTVDYA
ncbi:uncharacterized protein LOC135163436 [Diachasmimorpha longicaudata]|uniref:uncharacterized protein LOC135163436 n=1 Tax=Diachasmimorpha longicaudata TaxID=58733 RepID=UPI0030B89FCB